MLITRAKAIPIERELERRGHRLKRVGGELIGPCLVCGGTDRFGVNVRKHWNCRHCQRGGDVIDLVQHIDGAGFAEAVETLTGEKPRAVVKVAPKTKVNDDGAHERHQHDKARWLWSQRQPITGSVAERYLRDVRGITCTLPPTLAFLPPSKPEHHAAMIAAFGIPDEPEPGVLGIPRNVSAVHLTLLQPDGSGKVEVDPNKITIGSPAGMPLVLAPMNDSMGLVVTEGVEDALSVHQATGLGAWAAGSAPFMPKLAAAITHSEPECVTIWADADKPGQDAAHTLAPLLDVLDIEVFIEGLS